MVAITRELLTVWRLTELLVMPAARRVIWFPPRMKAPALFVKNRPSTSQFSKAVGVRRVEPAKTILAVPLLFGTPTGFQLVAELQ